MILSLEPSGTNASASIAAVSGLRTAHLRTEAFSIGKYLRHMSNGGRSPSSTSERTSPFPGFGFLLKSGFLGLSEPFLVLFRSSITSSSLRDTSLEPALATSEEGSDRDRQGLFLKIVLRKLWLLQIPVCRKMRERGMRFIFSVMTTPLVCTSFSRL